MLGLPSSINDALYKPTEALISDEPSYLQQGLARRTTIVVGKIIDRNVSSDRPSFAHTMTVEEELEAIEASMPKDWWDIPPALQNLGPEANKCRERLLLQLQFFHARAYLHMPFVVATRRASSYPHSRALCMQAASGVIRRHIALSGEIQGERFFDCRASIFISFMMAVVLILGLPGSRNLIDSRTSRQYREQITTVRGIIEQEERDRSCKISAQCSKGLTLLLDQQHRGQRVSESFSTVDNVPIPIPYFGSVIRRHATREQTAQSNEPKVHTLSPTSASEQDQFPSTSGENSHNEAGGPTTGFDLEQGYWEVEGDLDFNVDGLGPYLDSTWMDIDQGWGTFADSTVYDPSNF